MSLMRYPLALLLLAVSLPAADTGENVLLIVNRDSAVSQQIGEHYQRRRKVPASHICQIRAPEAETVSRDVYEKQVESPIRACLLAMPAEERAKIRFLATTKGAPLRIAATTSGPRSDGAAVDSELALLPRLMEREENTPDGPLANPFFGKYRSKFNVPEFRIYLVTRLAGFTFEDVRRMVDRCLEAGNRGLFVFDLSRANTGDGDKWMQAASRALPQDRVRVDDTTEILTGAKGVIGYASWGANDPQQRKSGLRDPQFEWLPGALATEYVSTDGRTFEEPPAAWRPGPWSDKERYFADSPQNLTADFIRQGASGASGHVYEPYLAGTPRPHYLFPAYYEGRTLAESYYLAIPYLSWMNIVVGDPLCSLGPP